MKMLIDFIDVEFFNIVEAKEKIGADTIVNAAGPTLMGGSNGSVDKAIHEKIDELENSKGYLKKLILDDKSISPSKNKNLIRCHRGEVVKTKGAKLCDTILHTVGPKYDGKDKIINTCSKSCGNVLRSCYRKIAEIAFYDPDIKVVAIPVIASGNYGFDFELAFKIGISEIYNTLLDIKRKNPELYKYTTLKKFCFVVNSKHRYEQAIDILNQYRKTFRQEKRVVSNGSFESQKQLLREILSYDSQKGYFSITKWLRFLLVICRMILFPLNYFKDWIGKENWEKRRNVVEVGVFLKLIIAGLGLLYFRYINGSVVINEIVCLIMIYNLADTILYLLSLIVLADIQNPSANVIRSMIMLAVNYVEIAIEITVIGISFFRDLVGIRELLRYTFLGETLGSEILLSAKIDWYMYLNSGIKFFFLTLLFAYFVNHLRQREFRVK